MSNKIIKKAAACGLSAVMAGLVAVTEAPKQLMLVQQQKGKEIIF